MELDLNAALEAARQAAREAEEVISSYLSSGQWSVTLKSDDTPVTEVDVAVENTIRKILMDALPEAGFFGEETGKSAGKFPGSDAVDTNGGLQWLVDPIDGTKSFVRGMPFYSTQIALLDDERIVLGVSNAPAWSEQLTAISGVGVWLNGQPVHTRADVTSIDEMFLSTGNLRSLAEDRPGWERFRPLVSRARRTRGYGDFCHYHQLCCGQADLIVESDVNILDIAALYVAVLEAGGVMTDLQGQTIDLDTTSVLAAGSEKLHAQALRMLNDH